MILIVMAGLIVLFEKILHKAFALSPVATPKTPQDSGLPYKDLLIPTVHNKKIQLWDLSVHENGPIIMGVHGWGNTGTIFFPIVRQLQKQWNFLLVNTRNHGSSDRERYSTLVQYHEDITAVIRFIKKKYPESPVVLLGHSLGAAASLLTAARDQRVQGVVAIASFADVGEMIRDGLQGKRFPSWLTFGLIKYIEYRIGAKFNRISPVNVIAKISCPILLIHGKKDRVVNFTDMERLAERADPARLETLPLEGHGHSSLLDDPRLIGKLESFLTHHFG